MSAPRCRKTCSRAESGHQSVEMCPLKTTGTHLSSSQRRCKQLNCLGKLIVWELSMHLTAPEGSLGKSWVGPIRRGGSCVAWRAELRVGWFPLQWADWVSLWLYLMLLQSQFSMNHFISFILSHPPTRTLLHTLKPPRIVPRNSPPSPVLRKSGLSFGLVLPCLYGSKGQRGDTDSFSLLWGPFAFCRLLSAVHGPAELAFPSRMLVRCAHSRATKSEPAF